MCAHCVTSVSVSFFILLSFWLTCVLVVYTGTSSTAATPWTVPSTRLPCGSRTTSWLNIPAVPSAGSTKPLWLLQQSSHWVQTSETLASDFPFCFPMKVHAMSSHSCHPTAALCHRHTVLELDSFLSPIPLETFLSTQVYS